MKHWRLIAAAMVALAVIVVGLAADSNAHKRYRKIIESIVRIDQRSAQIDQRAAQIDERTALTDSRVEQLEAQVADLGRRDVDLSGQRTPVSILSVGVTDNGPLAPVSMTKIGADQFLFVNYNDVYLFNLLTKQVSLVKLDGSVPIWHPTAIYYSSFYDQVFIANYTGADVLVTEIRREGEKVTLKLIERLTDEEGIKGPEGIQVSPGGRFMAVADYVGAALSVFERVDDAWVYRWKKPVESSHGVAIVGDYVYGAGTTITKFDIETGEQLASVSEIGVEPILFVSCISPDGETGDLIGSDTMTGRVFTLTGDLQLKHIFGANGPTNVNLSMPYCAYRDDGDIYVLSTYQDRIIKIGAKETLSFELGAPAWDYIPAPSAYRNPANMWKGELKFDNPSYSMLGKTIRPGYGSLVASDGTTFLLPARGSTVGNDYLFYVSTIASNEDWLAIVANSSPLALVYNRKTEAMGVVEIGEWNCWASASAVLCPARKYTVSELAAKATMIEMDASSSATPMDLAAAAGQTVPLLDYWQAWKKSAH